TCRERFVAEPARYAARPAMPPPAASADERVYTCPMHPQVRQKGPGSCPICGMALEPLVVAGDDVPDPELAEMTRRFWISLVLTLPLLAGVMGEMIPGAPVRHLIPGRLFVWAQLALATPVVLRGGWPFFVRGWASLVHRSLNMFTLIALGTGASYLFSLVAVLLPQAIPASFR